MKSHVTSYKIDIKNIKPAFFLIYVNILFKAVQKPMKNEVDQE